MVRVSIEVREGTDVFRVAVRAASISQAVSITKRRLPGRDVRVMFPIDAEEFFAGREGSSEDGARGRYVTQPLSRMDRRS